MGLFFGFWMGLVFAFQYGWKEGIFAGSFGGFFYGLLMAVFVYLQTRKFMKNRPLSRDERLIHEGPASNRGKGGWIYLTDSRLIFASHKITLINDEISIPLAEIILAERNRSYGVIPNKLILNLRNGETEEFVAQNVKDWINLINRATNLQIETARALYLND